MHKRNIFSHGYVPVAQPGSPSLISVAKVGSLMLSSTVNTAAACQTREDLQVACKYSKMKRQRGERASSSEVPDVPFFSTFRVSIRVDHCVR